MSQQNPNSHSQEIHGTRLTARAVFEAISRDGEEELSRTPVSLFVSALAAGLAITMSVLGKAFLYEALPEAPWRGLVSNLGYTFGFLIVILGRMQLFTENTITVVLPLVRERSGRAFGLAARLWAIVLLANLVGTFLAAVFTYYGLASGAQLEALISLSMPVFDNTALEMGIKAIPAGFLLAAVVWMLPNSRGFELWMILILTYLIGLGSFVHIIVGSAEAFVLAFAAKITWLQVVVQFLIPAFIGNVIGGTLLFSVLAYGQVQEKV